MIWKLKKYKKKGNIKGRRRKYNKRETQKHNTVPQLTIIRNICKNLLNLLMKDN
jgi:hypothetical protein